MNAPQGQERILHVYGLTAHPWMGVREPTGGTTAKDYQQQIALRALQRKRLLDERRAELELDDDFEKSSGGILKTSKSSSSPQPGSSKSSLCSPKGSPKAQGGTSSTTSGRGRKKRNPSISGKEQGIHVKIFTGPKKSPFGGGVRESGNVFGRSHVIKRPEEKPQKKGFIRKLRGWRWKKGEKDKKWTQNEDEEEFDFILSQAFPSIEAQNSRRTSDHSRLLFGALAEYGHVDTEEELEDHEQVRKVLKIEEQDDYKPRNASRSAMLARSTKFEFFTILINPCPLVLQTFLGKIRFRTRDPGKIQLRGPTENSEHPDAPLTRLLPKNTYSSSLHRKNSA